MTFNYYNIADNTTGVIVSQVAVDLDNDANALTNNTPPGTTAYTGLQTDTADTFYYVAGVKTARPLFSTAGSWNTLAITANGTSTATFSASLPNPTNIYIVVPLGLDIPAPITETSGSFSLNTTIAGSYVITFDAFPYQQAVYTVVAT
jgi:hypothetical protein